MAKTAKSPEDIDELAAQLETFAQTLRGVSTAMRSGGLKFLHCHTDTATSVYFPAIELWAGKIELELKPALRANEKGTKTRSEVVRDYESNKRTSEGPAAKATAKPVKARASSKKSARVK